MEIGHFYFLTNEYFEKFDDGFLMKNKESFGGRLHSRPCFYSFTFDNSGIYWMIPVSSNIKKYFEISKKKISKYGRCDTIVFGSILGHEKVFLIQNMCPVTDEYVNNEYMEDSNRPVLMSGEFTNNLLVKAKRVLKFQKSGSKLIIPDVLKIEKELLKELM